jgi:flagellar motor switch/type III secretory pathway protein FliN
VRLPRPTPEEDAIFVVEVEIGRTTLDLPSVSELRPGSILELDMRADEPLAIVVEKQFIALGEACVVDNFAGIRVIDLARRDAARVFAEPLPRVANPGNTPSILCRVIWSSTQMYMRDLLSLDEGSIIQLDKLSAEPCEIHFATGPVLHGEVVIIDGNFGVRVIDSPYFAEKRERVSSLPDEARETETEKRLSRLEKRLDTIEGISTPDESLSGPLELAPDELHILAVELPYMLVGTAALIVRCLTPRTAARLLSLLDPRLRQRIEQRILSQGWITDYAFERTQREIHRMIAMHRARITGADVLDDIRSADDEQP